MIIYACLRLLLLSATVILADATVAGVPTGVTQDTPLSAFGPVILVASVVIGLAAGAVAMYLRARSLAREVAQDYLESRDGAKRLGESLWLFVKTEDFAQWLGTKIDTQTASKVQELLAQMRQSTEAIQRLSGEVEKLIERLDRQAEKHEEQTERLVDLERRMLDRTRAG